MRQSIKKSFFQIKKTYLSLKTENKTMKSGSDAEWLSDNFYIFEQEYLAVKTIHPKGLNAKKAVQTMSRFIESFFAKHDYLLEESSLKSALDEAQKTSYFSSCALRMLPYCIRKALLTRAAVLCRTPQKDGLFKNIIFSFLALRNINMEKIFASHSVVDSIFSTDLIYEEMTENTKETYRKIITNLALKSKKSEHDVANAVVSLTKKKKGSAAHVGFFLIGNGRDELQDVLHLKRQKKINKSLIYILSVLSLTLLTGLSLFYITRQILWTLLSLIPISEIIVTLLQYVVLKSTPVRELPAIKSENCVSEPVLIVYPTLLSSAKKAEEMAKKLETAYLANCNHNLHFAILGDFKDANEKNEDTAIPNAASNAIRNLNAQYGDRFYFLHRSQVYSKAQKKWMGWERKRGALSDLNNFLRGEYTFEYTEGRIQNLQNLQNINYVLTLDDDTLLPPDSVTRLLGIALHPLNKPIIQNGIVTNGYGIIQPRICVRIESAWKTLFSRIFAGQGGIDTYHTSVSEFYMDLFGETVFTGKGLYHVDTFRKCMSIPPDTVLSHDLLEGNYVRCALASDVQVFDGFPHRFPAYVIRQHRWIRGDWQIMPWLFKFVRTENGDKVKNPLSVLSKWKIFENLRRSVTPIFQLILILFGNPLSVLTAFASLLFPMLLYCIDAILQKSFLYMGEKIYTFLIYGFRGILYQFTLSVAFLAQNAYYAFHAVVTGIYRTITHKKTLEWVTAADADTNGIFTLASSCIFMLPSVVIGLICLLLVLNGFFESGIKLILGIVFIIAPVLLYITGQESETKTPVLSKKREMLLRETAKHTWNFFRDYMTEEDHFLPPDNIQIKPYKGIAHRTSPTNIGFGMIACLCAYHLSFITAQELETRLTRTIDTIESLDKWKGHLYNWYDTKTLSPLSPRYISTVDSGNFVCYLIVVMMGISSIFDKSHPLIKRLQRLIENTNFIPLYNAKKNLFAIGFSVDENKLSSAYYDFLASEARQASFIAIALGQIPAKHWFSLGRGLTASDGYKGLMSWSGTMFEYFMPLLIMRTYRGTLLDETYRFALNCQKRYGRRRRIPWGVSESGFFGFDSDGSYQYKAFGVPSLGLVRQTDDDVVIAPYATLLALMIDPRTALQNMSLLKKAGVYGEYGFYEAVDYTPSRMHGNMRRGIVKSYMAHHAGMSLAAITNVLADNILQQYFHAYPKVHAYEPFLKERIPLRTQVMQARNERVLPVRSRYKAQNTCVRSFMRSDTLPRPITFLSNGSYHLLIDSSGFGYSSLDTVQFNKFYPARGGGESVYVVNPTTHDVWDGYGERCTFSGHAAEYFGSHGNIETVLSVTVCPDDNCASRRITIINKSGKRRVFEVYYYTDICLTVPSAALAHNTFSNLFVTTKMEADVLYAERRQRSNNEKTFIGFLTAYTEGNSIGEIQFDTDRLSFCGREGISPMTFEGTDILAGRQGIVLDPCFAVKLRISIESGESGSVTFLSGMAETHEKAASITKKYKKNPINFKEAAALYVKNNLPVNFKESEEIDIMHIAGYMLYGNNPDLSLYREKNTKMRNTLWKMGISGDYPILTVKISKEENAEILSTLVKAQKYWLYNGFRTDLVVFCDEPGGYTMPIYQMASKMKNTGIFILKRCDVDAGDINFLYAVSSVYIDSEKNGIKNIPPYPAIPQKRLPLKENHHDKKPDIPPLVYMNGYGGFHKENSEYVIIQTKGGSTPMPWVHVIANPSFGFIAGESGGGNTWCDNSHAFRISPWYNDAVLDPMGERLFLFDENDIWSPMAGTFREEGHFMTRYGFGYAVYTRITRDLFHEATLFTPPTGKKKIICLHIRNEGKSTRRFHVQYEFVPVLGVIEKADDIKIKVEKNCVYAENAMTNPNLSVYLSGGDDSICNGDGHLVRAKKEIELKPNETAEVVFVLGADNTPIVNAETALSETKAWWKNLLSGISVETDTVADDLLLSGWLLYQTVACRLFAKSAFYQSGGATGFRDQLQDALALLYTAPEMVKQQILYHAAYQFQEGDVFHWWHHDERGVRTRFTDDRLWLPYTLCRYLEVTEDESILDAPVSFIIEPPLEPHEEERYTFVKERTAPHPLYEHAVRAIEISLSKGQHGLPLMGGGDWNDGMNAVGIRGEGESVWLGWFLKHVLELFIPIAEKRGDIERAKRYKHEMHLLLEALEATWDNTHYARAYFDSGAPLGTSDSTECSIDAISQAWAVIAGGGRVSRQKTAMDTLYSTLVDREKGIIRLLAPPFQNSKESPGYIQSYPAGIRENGGQYTHGAIWVAIAFAMLGNPARALELFRMLNPVLRSETRVSANIYKAEPYVMTADIYTARDHVGRGGWSWYTGAASWMYQLGIQYILGFKKQGNIVSFKPCLPPEKLGFTLRYRYKSSMYIFHVHGNSEDPIVLSDDGKTHEITIGKKE